MMSPVKNTSLVLYLLQIAAKNTLGVVICHASPSIYLMNWTVG